MRCRSRRSAPSSRPCVMARRTRASSRSRAPLPGTIRENLDLLDEVRPPGRRRGHGARAPGPARAAGRAGRHHRAQLPDLRGACPGGRVPPVSPVDDPHNHRTTRPAPRSRSPSAPSAARPRSPRRGLRRSTAEVLADGIETGAAAPAPGSTWSHGRVRRRRCGPPPGPSGGWAAANVPRVRGAQRRRGRCTARWGHSRPAGSTCPASSPVRGVRGAAHAGETRSGLTWTRTQRRPPAPMP